MGSAVFAAQYQQALIPAVAAMIQRAWLSRRYKTKPDTQPGDRIVRSWDCASKEGLQSNRFRCSSPPYHDAHGVTAAFDKNHSPEPEPVAI